MKRTSLAIIIALSVFTMMAQEETVRVDFKGAGPTITDFLSAYLNTIPDVNDLEECEVEGVALLHGLRRAYLYQVEGIELEEGETLTIDKKNGYLLYEWRYDDENLSKIEMCFWNERDGKHKLFACFRETYSNGRYVCGQFDDREFFRYNNATKTMTPCSAEDIGVDAAYDVLENSFISFDLPRTGKDITVAWWNEKGKIKEKSLKWNGHRFNF